MKLVTLFFLELRNYQLFISSTNFYPSFLPIRMRVSNLRLGGNLIGEKSVSRANLCWQSLKRIGKFNGLPTKAKHK